MLKINSLISILTLSILSGCASLPEEYSELRKVHVAVNKIPYQNTRKAPPLRAGMDSV